MPIASVRIENFRAFEDSGEVIFGPATAIVGPNDIGKSVILHALNLFFNPPRSGGINLEDIHGKDSTKVAKVEIAFDPVRLVDTEVQIDSKNKIDLVDDCIIDAQDFLRLRLTASVSRIEAFEILISDIDDSSFPLALKNQDQLIAVLEEMGLEAKKAGKETNKEKRDRIRMAATADGAGLLEEWVDAMSFQSQLRAILPDFIFYTDSADYSIAVTSVQNQFKGVVNRALANSQNAKQFEDNIKHTIQSEFDKVFAHMGGLTDSVTKLEAEPKVNWKKAVDSIGLLWTDAAGLELPFQSRGAGTRRLFMVAYFHYEAAETIRDPSGPRFVFAIEEPEVHLHPGAQRELASALKDLSLLGHSVVFTTHSPVFVSSASIEELVLIQRDGLKSVVIQYPNLDITQVAADLGVEASDRLVGKDHVILVEGSSDVEFYQIVLSELHSSGLTSLDPSKVLFLQCGGISLVRFAVTTRCMDEAGLTWGIIVDSHRQVQGGVLGKHADWLMKNKPSTCSSLHILNRTCIENYLNPATVKKVTNIDCQIPKHGHLKTAAGNRLSKPDLKAVKGSVAQIASSMGQAELVAASQDTKGNCEWVTIFNGIASDFGL